MALEVIEDTKNECSSSKHNLKSSVEDSYSPTISVQKQHNIEYENLVINDTLEWARKSILKKLMTYICN